MAKKVVIVNDERHIARLLRVNFERDGWEVFEAYDGKEGFNVIQNEKPDVAVIDIVMPKMDGFELQKKMQDDDELRAIPIILLTARSGSECQRCGLGRPFHPRAVVAATNKILEQGLSDGGVEEEI